MNKKERMELNAIIRGWQDLSQMKEHQIENIRTRLITKTGPDGKPLTARDEARYMMAANAMVAQQLGDLQHQDRLEQQDKHHTEKLKTIKDTEFKIRIVDDNDA